MPRTRSLAWTELKIGVVMVAAVGLTMALILAVGGQTGFFWNRYNLFTVFPAVRGLKEGAVVRVAGVDVGQVDAIEFAGADVKVTMELREETKPRITTASRATLGSMSLLGEPVVDITASITGVPLDDGAFIPSAGAPVQVSDLTGLAAKALDDLSDVLQRVRAGEGTVGRLFTSEDVYGELHSLVSAAAAVASGIRHGEGTLGQLVTDPRAYRNLTGALDNLQQVTRRLASGEGTLGRLIADPTLATSLNASAHNLQELTGGIEKGQGTLGKLVNDPVLYTRLANTAARLEVMAANVQQGEGTMGRLVNDPDLYQNTNAAVRELRALVSDIREDPRRFLTVRVSLF